MANDRLIEVISPQSYEAIEKLRKELVEAMNATAQWNAELTKTKNLKPSGVSKAFRETTKAIKDTQSAMSGYEKTVEKNRLAEIKLSKEREKAFDKYERQLQKEKAAREAQVNKESQLRERLAAQRKREEDAIASQNQKRIEAARKLTVAYEKELFEAQQLKKERKEAAILSSKLATEYQKQEVKLAQLRKSYKDLAIQQQLHGNLTKEQVAQMNKFEKEAQKIDEALKRVDATMGQHQRNVGNYKSAFEGLKGTLSSLAGAFGLTSAVMIFSQLLKGAINNVKEFDSGLKNVQKTTGLDKIEIRELGDEIVDLSRRLGTVGTKKLLEYATVAGQLGVKGSQNILAFTETLAKLETASDIAGEQGGANIARLLTLVDGGVQNVSDFGDEIVRLGNNFAATENEILGNATAIAQNTGVYKLGRQAVLAYATATKAVGIESEITGSTIGKTLGLIEKALRTGQGIEAIVELTGKNINELQRLFKEDSGAVFTSLLSGLSKVDKAGGSVNEKLEQLGITAVRDQRVIGSLATAGYDTLARAITDVANASGALGEEFETASSKLENQYNRIGIAWDNLVLSFEKGDGVISGTVVKGFGILADNLNSLSAIISGNESIWTKWWNGIKLVGSYANIVGTAIRWFSSDTNELATSANDAASAIEKQNKAFIEQHGNLAPLTREQAEYIKNQKEINLLSGGGFFEDSSSDGGKGQTIKELQEQIQSLNKDLLDLDKNDKEGIKTKQKLIKELQEELDAILGTTRARQAQMEALKGTVSYFNQLISKLEEQRDKTARTKAEYDSFNLRISQLKHEVNLLNGEWDKWLRNLEVKPKDHDFSDAIKANVSALEAENSTLLYNAAIRAKRARDIAFQNEMIADAFVRFGSALGIQETTVRDLFSGIKDGFSDIGEAAKAFGNLAIDAINAVTASQNAQIDAQIANLQKQKEIELAFAGDSGRAREEIELRYQRKTAELKKRQAENAKRAAIVSAGINTAVAVTKTFAELGFPAGVLAASIIGTLGAAQIAFIASQPIPEFREGVRDFEGGKAIVGDGGKHEPITDGKGRLIGVSPNRPTLVDLPRGANVYSDFSELEREMNAILGGNNISPLGNAVNSPVVVYHGTNAKGMDASEMRKIMRDTLGNMPRNVLNIDQNGINVYAQKQYGKGQSLNNRVTFKGIDV